MSVRRESQQRFDKPLPAIQQAVDGALRHIGASSIQWWPDGSGVSASIAMGFFSWGEQLTVRLSPTGDVHIQSQCAFPLQLVDWGKNSRNCRRFLEAVAQFLTPPVRTQTG